jgi:DNA-binding winged helix-turn-helix (wHTH) protein/TolB-like protein/Tfp pilus assembly protein PilF
MHAPDNQVFEFGDFVLATKDRLLLYGGEPVPLTGKAFDLLIALVRRSGHLVSKDDLLREVWPDTFVEEVNLSVNISVLRKALERGSGNGMILTVPKRGYRFVAPVKAANAATARILYEDAAGRAFGRVPEPRQITPARLAQRPGAATRRGAVLIAAALVCAVIGTAALWRMRPENTAAPSRSIAVLPFAADAPNSNYLADGLAEATINNLAQVPHLRVAPRTNAFRYKGSQVRPADAGHELDVTAVVTGIVSQQDGRLRIQVDLIDVVGNAQIWGALYEGDASELIHLQTRISQDLSRELKIPLSGEELQRFARHVTENADAYRAYLQGRYDWNQRSEAGLKRGIEGFERAVEIDPRFAAAYSGLADSYAALGYLSYIAPAEAFPVARSHALKALEMDGSLAEPHASLGYVKLYFDWDWSGAETEFRRAIELDANYAATHQWYSIYLLAAGRAEESFREIQVARERDSLSLPINTDLGFHYYYTRQYDEAVKQLKFVLEMKGDFPPAHLWLGRSYQELGRFDDALTEFRQVEQKLPEWPVAIAARGFVEGAAGHAAEAEQTLAELRRLSGRRFVTSYGVALVYAGLGRNDDAFTWLNRAFDERSHWLVWLRLDPRWDRLRPDPRFLDLVSRMRFPQ